MGGGGEAGAGRARSALSQPRGVPARSQGPGVGSWAGQRCAHNKQGRCGTGQECSQQGTFPLLFPLPTRCPSLWALGHSCLEAWLEAPEAEPAWFPGRTQDHWALGAISPV